jgi:hypothetical protein
MKHGINKPVMLLETTRYWQRKVAKNAPLASPCLSVNLSLYSKSSKTEWISYWRVLLKAYLILLTFGSKMDNICE